MVRQIEPKSGRARVPTKGRELPVGSELVIALPLGVTAWWAIVHAVVWIAG